MADVGMSVAVDSHDDIIVGGIFGGFFGQGFLGVKYDAEGELLWTRRYGGMEPFGIAVDSDDNFVLTGHNWSEVTNFVTWYTIKCDRDGHMLWKNEYHSGFHDSAEEVVVDDQGSVITVGYSAFSSEDNREHCMIIYGPDGEEMCMKRSGVHGFLLGVALDERGIIVTGGVENLQGWDYYTDRYYDVTPPSVFLEHPQEGYLYLFNRRILSLPRKTIIGGRVTVSLGAEDPGDVERVEFYLDNQLVETLTEPPYAWEWRERTWGRHTVKTMVYDDSGACARHEIPVWKIF
jgi:hypothetical protein